METNKEEITNIDINKENLSKFKMPLDGDFLWALLLFVLSSGQSFGGYPCPMQSYNTQPPIYININSNNINDKKEENKKNA